MQRPNTVVPYASTFVDKFYRYVIFVFVFEFAYLFLIVFYYLVLVLLFFVLVLVLVNKFVIFPFFRHFRFRFR